MKFLVNLSLAHKITSIGLTLLVALAVALIEATRLEPVSVASHSPAPAISPVDAGLSSPDKIVQVYDQGLELPISSFAIPASWFLDQDVANDPITGQPLRYRFVLHGPGEQYIRSFVGQFPYGAINNVPFSYALQQAIEHVIAHEALHDLQIDAALPCAELMRAPRVQEFAQAISSQGRSMDVSQIYFTGMRGGKTYRGRICFINAVSPAGDFGILQPRRLLFAPADEFAAVEQVEALISNTSVANPRHRQVMAQVNQLRPRAWPQSHDLLRLTATARSCRMADRAAQLHLQKAAPHLTNHPIGGEPPIDFVSLQRK